MRIALTVLGALLLGALAAPAQAAPRCDRRGLEVVVANERVMVLSRRFHGGEDTRFYGCRRGTRRLRVLGEQVGLDVSGANGFALSRNWVGWAEDVCSRHDGCATQSVQALNLLTMRAVALETDGSVDWHLSPAGRLVVLDGGRRAPWDQRYPGRVRVTGTTGTHLLAAGDDLDPYSLTVGERARWTRAGVPESAGIP